MAESDQTADYWGSGTAPAEFWLSDSGVFISGVIRHRAKSQGSLQENTCQTTLIVINSSQLFPWIPAARLNTWWGHGAAAEGKLAAHWSGAFVKKKKKNTTLMTLNGRRVWIPITWLNPRSRCFLLRHVKIKKTGRPFHQSCGSFPVSPAAANCVLNLF